LDQTQNSGFCACAALYGTLGWVLASQIADSWISTRIRGKGTAW